MFPKGKTTMQKSPLLQIKKLQYLNRLRELVCYFHYNFRIMLDINECCVSNLKIFFFSKHFIFFVYWSKSKLMKCVALDNPLFYMFMNHDETRYNASVLLQLLSCCTLRLTRPALQKKQAHSACTEFSASYSTPTSLYY